ncbi:Uncharacterized protein PBTT_07436 [Plasmodiophora brassicae]|uniref:Uncharacterized protein n=1 Tax=Plasmodiophora brassicae TaxID=37360 RepID=A0A0G4IMV5_PLABS|nr:hypothetical protein PBRA_005093 [Plasmodiophora brassicae]SPQ99362.1 unnamed protein product [Plasmodiophora brassicae]
MAPDYEGALRLLKVARGHIEAGRRALSGIGPDARAVDHVRCKLDGLWRRHRALTIAIVSGEAHDLGDLRAVSDDILRLRQTAEHLQAFLSTSETTVFMTFQLAIADGMPKETRVISARNDSGATLFAQQALIDNGGDDPVIADVEGVLPSVIDDPGAVLNIAVNLSARDPTRTVVVKFERQQ